MANPPALTVVLPVHNAEATLKRSVDHILEVAAELTPSIELLIVDDGSTDDSFDIAREIAVRLPQVRVVRQAQQRGLGPTLKRVSRRVKSDVVMVHDGVSRMDAEQLRRLWKRRLDSQHAGPGGPQDVSLDDLLRPKRNQAAMEAAHGRLMGFQMLGETVVGTASASAIEESPASTQPGHGVGAIPPLPRPNFMGAVGEFALGE